MAFEHIFEEVPSDLGARKARLAAALTRLPSPRSDGQPSVLDDRPLTDHGRREPATGQAVPVLGPLAGLLPDGLRRGDVVCVRTRDRAVDYLTLALLAGALGAGLWCSAVGTPDLGGLALAEMLSDGANGDLALDRFLLVPSPGDRWPEVARELAGGVDLLVLRPPAAVPAEVSRRLDARLRQGRSVGTRHSPAVLVLGEWASARLVLTTESTEWTGLHDSGPWAGTGHLTGGRATLSAQGRDTGGRRRSIEVWLPTATGTVAPVLPEQAAPAQPGRRGLTAVA